MELFKKQNYIKNCGWPGKGTHMNGHWTHAAAMCDGKWTNSCRNCTQCLTVLAMNDLRVPFLISEILSFFIRRGLEVGGLRKIPVVLVTMFRPVTMVHLNWVTRGGHLCGLDWVRVTRPRTGAPDPDSSFLEGIGNQRIVWGDAFQWEFTLNLLSLESLVRSRRLRAVWTLW